MQRNSQNTIAGFARIEDLIEKVISDTPTLAANPIGNWEDIVGKTLSKYSKPVKYSNGKLTIHVIDSVWKHHLTLHKEELIAKINNVKGQKIVKDIVFKVGEIEDEEEEEINLAWKKHKSKKGKTSRKGRKKAKKYELSTDSKKFISSLKDPEFKAFARRFLRLFPPE